LAVHPKVVPTLPLRHRVGTSGSGEVNKFSVTRRTVVPMISTLIGVPWATWAGESSSLALEAGAAASAEKPEVTQRIEVIVAVQLSAEETVRKRMVLGLYAKEAPDACRIFAALSGGTLEAPCRGDDSDNEAFARSGLTKRGVTRACLAEESRPVPYSGSTVWRIVKDKRVDLGQVQGKFAQRAAPSWPSSDATARVAHDRAGLLSVPRGGGTFDFTLTLAPLPELDASAVVIGEVLEGMDALQYLNDLPVVNYTGQGAGSDASRSKQCFYGSADTFCSQGKPIKKCTLATAVL
jgi:cyclophilin family peptidyl-prolyl cis-trans isomerase